jgi:predicted permease
MLNDLRFALRSLSRTPLFTIVSLVSLALGIGANSAVFTVADQVLLRLLHVKHARDLVLFTTNGPQRGMVFGENMFSYPMFQDFRDYNLVFDGVAARFATPLHMAYGNSSERIQAEIVSGTYFETLGIDTILGRPILPEDDRTPGARPVVVLTYEFWQSRFGHNPAIVNQAIRLNGHPMTVIGVAAPGYRGFDVGVRTDVLVPAMMKAQMTPTWNGLDDRRVLWLQLIGHLKRGVSARQAQASLQPYYRSLLEMELQSMPRMTPKFTQKPLVFVPAMRGVSDLREQYSAPLLILFAIVGLLLLIACANVANLLLARAAGRQKEIAVRLAVGASRFRLVRQLVVESVVLSLGGGALALIFAAWTSGPLMGLLANSSDLGLTSELDLRVFGFTFALAFATGVIFGLVPAWQATSPALANTLKDQAGNVSAGGGYVRLRQILVVSQVSLSLLMLIAAALFARSLHNLKNVNLGFRRENLMTFTLDPSLNGYTPERIRKFAENMRHRLAGIPGVRSAAAGENPVISDNDNMMTVHVEGYQPKEGEDMNPSVDSVSPGYFSTMGIPLLAGREFNDRDRSGAPRVALVNDVFARYYFRSESPIGRRFGFGREDKEQKGLIEIVGVVRSSRYRKVDETTPRVVYTALAQDDNPSMLVVYVRTAADPGNVFPAIRREVRSMDPSLPITAMRTMEEQVNENLSAQRLIATLSAFFGTLATLLAAVGLYGVMAYSVTRRTREIGIRVALGAGRRSLLGLVMREVALLTASGVAIAVPVALALTRFVRAQLFGVLPSDPLSMAAAALVLILVALLAGYIPAQRATHVNPISALRYE